jgi:hypothetical protein
MKKIVIDKPCSVNWNSMKKIDGGRFCEVCNREVWDYSNKSADEIAQMIENLSTINFCAKYNVEHVIVLDKRHSQTHITRYLAAFSFAILMLFGCKTKKKTVYSSGRFLDDESPKKTEQKAK